MKRSILGYSIVGAVAVAAAGSFSYIKLKDHVIGTTKGSQGSAALFDLPCTLGDKGNHLEIYNRDKSVTEIGCWLIEDNVLFLFSPKFGPGSTDPSVVTWK